MEVLVLAAVLSLASATCNNVQTTSYCGQNNAANSGYTYNGPYAIFNSGNYGYGYGGQQYTSGAYSRGSCLSVDVIPITLQEVACNSPTYVTVVENSPQNRLLDSVCTTFYPVPGDDNSYFAYISSVRTDGANQVTTSIYTQIAPGVFGVSNTDYTITQRVYASIGQNTVITCTRNEFGVSDFPQTIVSPLGSLTGVSYSCLQQITSIMSCNGLYPAEGLYVLPYRMPPRCYTQQSCYNNPLAVFGAGCNSGGFQSTYI